jgi:RNA polymerase sigma-70 factor (ECF subfamily)
MQRCRLGDTAAFDELVRRWQRPIARVLGRLAAPKSDIDDLCQQVFVRVLLARERYRPEGAFSTWLYRIALNIARDAARRARWRSLWQPLANQNHHPASTAPSPEDAASREEIGRGVQEALASLPAKLREVLVLRHFGELTFADMAQVTGLPASTVKSRFRAGLEALRSELQRRGITEQELQP